MLAPRGKLHYWSVRACGYPVAVIAAAAGCHLEFPLGDKTAEFAAQQRAGVLTFGQWPAVEFEGRWLVQSGAIMRFFARRGGLDGGTDVYHSELLMSEAEDIYLAISRAFHTRDGAANNNHMAMDALFAPGSGWFARQAALLERKLAGGGGADPFFSAGPARLAGEYYLACELDCARDIQADCLATTPRLLAFAEAMLDLPAFDRVKDFPQFFRRS